MALEMNDLLALKSMGKGDDMSAYEQFKVGHMQSRRASGTAIAGLGVGIGAAVAAIGAGLWAGSRAQNAKEVAIAKNDGLKDLVTTLATTLAAERAERINGDQFTFTQTQTDTQSGSQQGSIANQIENSAVAQATQTLLTQAMLGNLSENAQKVQIYSAPQPCGCPGCGYNG